MDQNKKSEIFAAIVTGLGTLWTSYKRTTRRRNQSPMEMLVDDIFGRELTDVEAAVCLVDDVLEIKNKVQKKATDKKFKDIIKNSY